jgi:hypothetical protein
VQELDLGADEIWDDPGWQNQLKKIRSAEIVVKGWGNADDVNLQRTSWTKELSHQESFRGNQDAAMSMERAMNNINWDDPAARLALIERVGHEEYSRLIGEHFRKQTITVVNGYGIRKINTRFGQLFMVDGSPDQRAYSTLFYADTLGERGAQ